MAKKKAPKRGGPRPGSGRKPTHTEGKTIKVVASIPDTLVEKLEALADEKGWSRSQAITEAVRRMVRRT